MVRFAATTSVVLVQLAFLARITVSLPVPSTATFESRALSTSDEENDYQQLSERTFDTISCVAGVFIGIAISTIACNGNYFWGRRKKTPPANEPPVEPPVERPTGRPRNDHDAIELASLNREQPNGPDTRPSTGTSSSDSLPPSRYGQYGTGPDLPRRPPPPPPPGPPRGRSARQGPNYSRPSSAGPQRQQQPPPGNTPDRPDEQSRTTLGAGPQLPQPAYDSRLVRPPISRRPSGYAGPSHQSSSTTLNNDFGSMPPLRHQASTLSTAPLLPKPGSR